MSEISCWLSGKDRKERKKRNYSQFYMYVYFSFFFSCHSFLFFWLFRSYYVWKWISENVLIILLNEARFYSNNFMLIRQVWSLVNIMNAIDFNRLKYKSNHCCQLRDHCNFYIEIICRLNYSFKSFTYIMMNYSYFSVSYDCLFIMNTWFIRTS